MVIDFPGGSPRRTPADAASTEEKRKEAKARRLSTAPEIADSLKRMGRMHEADRERMARNLGRMWERAQKDRHTENLSSLFERAFGQRDGMPVNFKKRKRFLLKHDEEPERVRKGAGAVFQAPGRDYLALAEALAKSTAGSRGAEAAEEDRRRAVLLLVEGTSLGRYTSPADKLRSAAVAEIARIADLVAARIESAVDLDWMREVLGHYDVSAVIDAEGGIRRLLPTVATWDEVWRLQQEKADLFRSHLPESFQSLDELSPDLREDFEAAVHIETGRRGNETPMVLWPTDMDIGEGYDDWSWHRFAPRVVLAHVLTPVELKSGRIDVPFDLADMKAEVEARAQAFGRAVARVGKAAHGISFDKAEAERMYLEPVVARGLATHHGLKETPESLSELETALEEDNLWLWDNSEADTILVRRRLELQLAYDEALDRWGLCLALVHGVGGFEYQAREGVYGAPTHDGGFRPATNFGSASFYGSLMAVPRDKSTLSVFCVEDEACPPDDYLGMGWRSLALHGTASCDALLTRIIDGQLDGHDVRLDLRDESSKPAPAPADTLAGYILRNLAYAPEEERLDLRLLRDARLKAGMLAQHVATMRSDYDAAIRRLER